VPQVYVLSCRALGIGCDFETRGENIEAVMKHCAEHAMLLRGVKSFGPELYLKMRSQMKTVEE